MRTTAASAFDTFSRKCNASPPKLTYLTFDLHTSKETRCSATVSNTCADRMRPPRRHRLQPARRFARVFTPPKINMHNFNRTPAEVEKRVLQLVQNDKPVGREPESVSAKAFDRIVLKPETATMDDCCRFAEKLRLIQPTSTSVSSKS